MNVNTFTINCIWCIIHARNSETDESYPNVLPIIRITDWIHLEIATMRIKWIIYPTKWHSICLYNNMTVRFGIGFFLCDCVRISNSKPLSMSLCTSPSDYLIRRQSLFTLIINWGELNFFFCFSTDFTRNNQECWHIGVAPGWIIDCNDSKTSDRFVEENLLTANFSSGL